MIGPPPAGNSRTSIRESLHAIWATALHRNDDSGAYWSFAEELRTCKGTVEKCERRYKKDNRQRPHRRQVLLFGYNTFSRFLRRTSETSVRRANPRPLSKTQMIRCVHFRCKSVLQLLPNDAYDGFINPFLNVCFSLVDILNLVHEDIRYSTKYTGVYSYFRVLFELLFKSIKACPSDTSRSS